MRLLPDFSYILRPHIQIEPDDELAGDERVAGDQLVRVAPEAYARVRAEFARCPAGLDAAGEQVLREVLGEDVANRLRGWALSPPLAHV